MYFHRTKMFGFDAHLTCDKFLCFDRERPLVICNVFYSVLEGITWHFLCMDETVTVQYFVCNAKCETMWLFVRYCLIFCKSPARVIVYRKFCELLVKRIMWNLVLTRHWSGIHFINVCTIFALGNKLQQHNYSCRYKLFLSKSGLTSRPMLRSLGPSDAYIHNKTGL